MSLLLTFMELDKLYESAERLNRGQLIKNIKDLGKNYNFDKYSDEQLYRMWQRLQNDLDKTATMQEYTNELKTSNANTCQECSMKLTDGGMCPKCDDGEEDLAEAKLPIGTEFKWTSDANKPIVRIMYTGNNKFIAVADDGTNGKNKVVFNNQFKKHNGELYEVDQLEWNGKNYKAVGNIKYLGNIVDLYQHSNE